MVFSSVLVKVLEISFSEMSVLIWESVLNLWSICSNFQSMWYFVIFNY